MIKAIKRLVLCAFWVLSVGTALGQQTATEILRLAEESYRTGNLTNIPGLLRGPLENRQFSEEERVRALKLLTLVHIFSDQEALAEQSLIRLLRADPEHILDPLVDPAELFFLYQQFRTAPIFRIGVRGGMNATMPLVLSEYGTQNTGLYPVFYNGKTADGRRSFQVEGEEDPREPEEGATLSMWGEIQFEKQLYKGLDGRFGVQVRNSIYNVEVFVNNSGLEVAPARNRQLAARAPLSVSYTLGHANRSQRLLPYVFAGGSLDFLLQAGYSEARRVGGSGFTVTDSDFIAEGIVNKWNLSYFGGLGLKIRNKTHFITLDARYDANVFQVMRADARWSNPTYAFDLGLAESNILMRYISFSLGYTRSIHNPKKITP